MPCRGLPDGGQDSKPQKFKNSMIEKMGEFLESFSDRNLFNDDLLAGFVDRPDMS